MLDRKSPLHLWVPANLKEHLEYDFKAYCILPFELVIHPLDTTARTVLYEDEEIMVETIATGHSTSRQAAQIAKEAKVGRLALGHYSIRYKEEDILLRNYVKFTQNSCK